MTSHTASGALLITITWLVVHGQARFLHNESPNYDNNEIEASFNKSNPHRTLAAIPALDPSILLNLPFGTPPGLSEDILGAHITQEDFNSNSRDTQQDHITNDTKIDPLELAGAFEGDIILGTPAEFLLMTQPGKDPLTRGAISSESRGARIWPSRVIHYRISDKFNDRERRTIMNGVQSLDQYTCVNFVLRIGTKPEDYINIIKGNGCSSLIGYGGGAQKVSLGNGCIREDIVMRQLMFSAGVKSTINGPGISWDDIKKLNNMYNCR